MSKLSYPLSFPHVSADEEVNIDEEPVDTGLIRCICDSTEDDGFTIQCDRCLTWQHAYCMNISQKNIPDRYLCALCDKRPPIRVDKKRRDGKPHPPKRTRDDEPSQLNPITKPTTTKKPKLSKRISVPKRAMDASSLVFSRSKQDGTPSTSPQPPSSPHHPQQLHHPRKKFHLTTSDHVKSKFAHLVIQDAKLKWSRSPKWQTKPWRPTDAQEASVLHQELFTVMDKVSLEQQPYPHRPCLVRPLAKQAAHRVPSKSRKGVFADTQLLANTFLMQAHGDVLLKSEFKFDATNDYALLGTPCAHVLFYPSLDLCIDARERGNDARHFRRSCHPNAEVRAMVLSNGPSPATSPASPPPPSPPTTASSSTQHSICLGIFSRSSIQPDEEITLGWHWQKGHIAWRKHVEWIHSHGDCPPKDEDLALEEALQPQHRRAIQLMLDRFEAEFGDCACGDRDVCLIERLRQECYNGMVLTPTGSKYRSLPVSRQTSTGSLGKTGTTIAHSPAPIITTTLSAVSISSAAADETMDVDVISMSPSRPTTPTKKDTATSDEEGDIDIDIGDDLPTQVPEESSEDDIKTKPLPFKKAWARHHRQQDEEPVMKQEDKTEATLLPTSPPSPTHTQAEAPASAAPMALLAPPPPIAVIPAPAAVSPQDEPTAMDVDEDDDGHLSDASSASTLPLDPEEDEDSAPWARPLPPAPVIQEEPMREPDETAHLSPPKDKVTSEAEAAATATALDQQQQTVAPPQPDPSSSAPLALTLSTSNSSIPVLQASSSNSSMSSADSEPTSDSPVDKPVLDKDNSDAPHSPDNASIPTPHALPASHEPSASEPPPEDESAPHPKPNKVKVSLQEYLSRRQGQQPKE